MKTKRKKLGGCCAAILAMSTYGVAAGTVNYRTPTAGDAWTSRAVYSSVSIEHARSHAFSATLGAFEARETTWSLPMFVAPFSSIPLSFILFVR